ncbi:hypothetical protein NAG83_23960 [Pseudomonas carnis]|uniref:hypothetical protein n=1 Tax=Pseudomonas carnis TaxID=2487355 RepID=UPI002094921F|nr:hypothetical protein [Pseudomonas carnis]MCO7039563.1 hypothetical protein [Pseudomonas carnis]
MLMDQSQSEKDKIIGWLVRAFGTRLGTKFIDDAEQLKRRTAALQRIQDHAYLEGGLYKAHLLTIVKTLVAPNSDGDGDHDWLRNKLTSLANQSAPKSVPALKKAQLRNQILAMVDAIPALLEEGEGVKVLRWEWTD